MLKIIPVGYCFKKSPMRQKDTFTENNLFNEFTWTLDNLFPNLGKVVFQKKHNSFYMLANTTTFCSLLQFTNKRNNIPPPSVCFHSLFHGLDQGGCLDFLIPKYGHLRSTAAEKSEKSSYEEYSRLRNLHMRSRAV